MVWALEVFSGRGADHLSVGVEERTRVGRLDDRRHVERAVADRAGRRLEAEHAEAAVAAGYAPRRGSGLRTLSTLVNWLYFRCVAGAFAVALP